MRAVIQRVSRASVRVNGEICSEMQHGLVVLLSVGKTDGVADQQWLSEKILRLRLFDDASGSMQHSLLETGGDLLVVSQFTLHAYIKKGQRPSFHAAAAADDARALYEAFIASLRASLWRPDAVKAGVFGAEMQLALINEGPVTFYPDTKATQATSRTVSPWPLAPATSGYAA